jgi:hypothetical protein
MTTFDQECEKFTTEQLKESLIALYKRNDEDSKHAYLMTFDALCKRMGEEAFDAWCDTWYV